MIFQYSIVLSKSASLPSKIPFGRFGLSYHVEIDCFSQNSKVNKATNFPLRSTLNSPYTMWVTGVLALSWNQ